MYVIDSVERFHMHGVNLLNSLGIYWSELHAFEIKLSVENTNSQIFRTIPTYI